MSRRRFYVVYVFQLLICLVKLLAYYFTFFIVFIFLMTPTHGQYCFALWRLLSSPVVCVVCNSLRRRICNVTHQGAARDGGPVVLCAVRGYLVIFFLPFGCIKICSIFRFFALYKSNFVNCNVDRFVFLNFSNLCLF